MIISLTNGTDYINFIFDSKLNSDLAECNIVDIRLKIGNLNYAYQEEFLTQAIYNFYNDISQRTSYEATLYGIGLVLILRKQGNLGHYQAHVAVDNSTDKIKIDISFGVSTIDIDRFLGSLCELVKK